MGEPCFAIYLKDVTEKVNSKIALFKTVEE